MSVIHDLAAGLFWGGHPALPELEADINYIDQSALLQFGLLIERDR